MYNNEPVNRALPSITVIQKPITVMDERNGEKEIRYAEDISAKQRGGLKTHKAEDMLR